MLPLRRPFPLAWLMVAGCAPAVSPVLPPPSLPAAASPPLASAPAPSSVVAPSAAPVPAPYRAVHIDSLVPAKRAQFEQARKEWVAELRRVGASDWRGLFVDAGDRFYSVRPLERLGSLDPTPDDPKAPPTPEPSEAAGKRYDDLSDDALAFPHTSEIWAPATTFSYAPATGAVTEQTAECGTLTVEDVRADTTSMKQYGRAVREIVATLKDAHYPLSRVAYRTSYGAGHLYTFLLAPNTAAVAAAPRVEDVLAQAKGAAKAKELLGAIDAAVVRREVVPITVRHDLTVP